MSDADLRALERDPSKRREWLRACIRAGVFTSGMRHDHPWPSTLDRVMGSAVTTIWPPYSVTGSPGAKCVYRETRTQFVLDGTPYGWRVEETQEAKALRPDIYERRMAAVRRSAARLLGKLSDQPWGDSGGTRSGMLNLLTPGGPAPE